MSANKQRPHLLVIPEDDANRQLANGFVQALPIQRQRQIQVLPPAGGLSSVLGRFETEYLKKLNQLVCRNVLLLIDFDDVVDDRLARCRQSIPDQVSGRVFVLGVRREPEDLKRALPNFTLEGIGSVLAQECLDARLDRWDHELLACNAGECERLRRALPGFFN